MGMEAAEVLAYSSMFMKNFSSGYLGPFCGRLDDADIRLVGYDPGHIIQADLVPLHHLDNALGDDFDREIVDLPAVHVKVATPPGRTPRLLYGNRVPARRPNELQGAGAVGSENRGDDASVSVCRSQR